MKFRYVRRSNDSYVWLLLILSLLGVAAFICNLLPADPAFPRGVSLAAIVVLLVGIFWCVRAILNPFEWEVVVENGQICWGRADQQERQQRVAISKLVRLIWDKKEGEVVGDIGHFPPSLKIGEGILIRSEDQGALVDYLRQSYPQLKIEIN
ncbi:MAG TPA: hypothetical protein VL527_04915 [Dongiaceae bacterium]|nr:hypothetical protein [Dongiaceae bacterium]